MPLVCFISGCKSSYPELEVLHPLPYHFILWGRGVGHLELEQVIASWSIAVLVKHNRGAGTACAEQSKREDAKKKKEKVLDVGVEKQKTLYLVAPDSLVAYKDKAKESVCLSPNINLQKQRRIS